MVLLSTDREHRPGGTLRRGLRRHRGRGLDLAEYDLRVPPLRRQRTREVAGYDHGDTERRGAAGGRLEPDGRNRARNDQGQLEHGGRLLDRKSTRLNSSHANISYAVFCL